MRTRALGAALALMAALALAGCSSSTPQGRLLERLNAVTQAANAKDATAIRTAVDRFKAEVSLQGNAGDLTVAGVVRYTALANKVLTDADLVDQAKIDQRKSAAAAAASASAAAAAQASAAAAASASAVASASAAAAASASAVASASAAARPSPSPSPLPSPSPVPSPAPSVLPTP